MLDLTTSDYNFIITNLAFNDFHKGQDGTYTFKIKFEISNFVSYSSKDYDKLRFDADIAMVSTVSNEHIGFTLNASIQLIIKLNKDINKEKIKDLITNKNSNNLKAIDGIIRPIITKEIEKLLQKTFYKDVSLDKLHQNNMQ